MNTEKSFELILTEPLTHNEVEMLKREATNFGIPIATFHGGQNLIIRFEFDDEMNKEFLNQQIIQIARWINKVGGVEIIGRVRKIEDFYTDFISDEIKTLTKYKETS